MDNDDIVMRSPSPSSEGGQPGVSARLSDQSSGDDWLTSEDSGESDVSSYGQPPAKVRRRTKRKKERSDASAETDDENEDVTTRRRKERVVPLTPDISSPSESSDHEDAEGKGSVSESDDEEDVTDLVTNWEGIGEMTAHGRPAVIPFRRLPGTYDGELLTELESQTVRTPVNGYPRCYGSVAAPATSLNPEELGIEDYHQPLERRKLEAYIDVPMETELVQRIAPLDGKQLGGFVRPLGAHFTLSRTDLSYVSGTRYLTVFNVGSRERETQRLKHMTLPPTDELVYDKENGLMRKPVAEAHAMVPGVPYVVQIIHPAHPEYARYPLTIACFHTPSSIKALLNDAEYQQLKRNVQRYCELLWGKDKRQGLVDFPFKPNDRSTRGEKKAKKLAGGKQSQSRLPDPPKVTVEDVEDEETESLDFAAATGKSKEDRYRGPLSTSIGGTVINQGSGIFSPAAQDLRPRMKAVLWEFMIILRYFYMTILPLCISYFEWENLQFYFLDQNAFSLGGYGPGPVSAQLNRSDTFNAWNTLNSLVDEIFRQLSEAIGFQGKLHGDISDDPGVLTMCVITFRFDETVNGAHYGGSFHLPRHGLYIAELGLLICWLIFNARDLHGGEAPGHLRTVIENALNMMPNKEEILRTWATVGRFNRTCVVLYTSHKVMSRVAPTQVTPTTGYANQGVTPSHQSYVRSYAMDGTHLMGDRYDRELRFVTERVYADTTAAFLSGTAPFTTLKDALETVHAAFGGTRRDEVTLAGMSWLEIFTRRRLLAFYKELCNNRLLAVTTEDLRKTGRQLRRTVNNISRESKETTTTTTTIIPTPRLILPAPGSLSLPVQPTPAGMSTSPPPPSPPFLAEDRTVNGPVAKVVDHAARGIENQPIASSSSAIETIVKCTNAQGKGSKRAFCISRETVNSLFTTDPELEWVPLRDIRERGFMDIVLPYCRRVGLPVPRELNTLENGLPSYLQLCDDTLASYIDPDTFARDLEQLLQLRTAVVTSAEWKHSVDLSEFASRLAKERKQFSARQKEEEEEEHLNPIEATTQLAIYEFDFLEANVSSFGDDLSTMAKLDVIRRAAVAGFARGLIVLRKWILTARESTVKTFVGKLWLSWDVVPVLAKRNSLLAAAVWQIELAILSAVLDAEKVTWRMPESYPMPTKSALDDIWREFCDANNRGSQSMAKLPLSLYGFFTRTKIHGAGSLKVPTIKKRSVITLARVQELVVDTLCDFLEREFIFSKACMFDREPKDKALSEEWAQRVRGHTLLRCEILFQMVEAYEGDGILYTDMARDVLLKPEQILRDPCRSVQLAQKINEYEFPSLFPTPPPPELISQLAGLKGNVEEFLDAVASKGVVATATDQRIDGLLVPKHLAKSDLPWENSEMFAARWEMVSIMFLEGAAFDERDEGTSCVIGVHHNFLSGAIKNQEGGVLRVDVDSIHPFRSLNPMTTLLREYYSAPTAFTRETGLAELVTYHGHGQGYGTKEGLEALSPPYDSLAHALTAFSNNYHKKISNANVWGTASRSLMHSGKRKRGADRARKRTTTEEQRQLSHRLARYWSPTVTQEWRGLLESHNMLNIDPTSHPKAERPTWAEFYEMMARIALPGFSKKTLTLMQLANTLTIFDVIQPPTLQDTGQLIVSLNKGAVAGLRFLGFPCRDSRETCAGFLAFFRWCDGNMTPETRARTKFTPNMAEHLLCKVGRWQRRTVNAVCPLMTMEWLDSVRDMVTPWPVIDSETLSTAMLEVAEWNL